jgi:transposase
MDVLHPRCCGLDVHKSSISACILLREAGRVQKHQRRFGAMTQELRELAEWLRQFGVTQLAMESSGVYWKPVWNILEGQFTVVLAVWSSAGQLYTLRNHSRSTRPNQNAGQSVPGSFAHP